MIATTISPGATASMPGVTAAPLLAAMTSATGSNHDQQERAPAICEDAPPLRGAIQEVSRQLPLVHALPLHYVYLVSKRFHLDQSLSEELIITQEEPFATFIYISESERTLALLSRSGCF